MISLNTNFDAAEEQALKALREGNTHDSIQYYREAVAKNPNDPKLATELAAVLLKNQCYQESINEADHALEMNPSCVQAYYIEAIAKLFLDQHQEALNAINKAIQLNAGGASKATIKSKADEPKAVKESIQKNAPTVKFFSMDFSKAISFANHN